MKREPIVAKLPDGYYLVSYRRPKPSRGYAKPRLLWFKAGKPLLLHRETRVLPATDIRLDLGDRYVRLRRKPSGTHD
jgi:hypothetical protein